MKKLMLSIVLLAGMYTAAFAQCDPGFGATPAYTGTSVSAGGVPTIEVGQTATLNASFGVGSDPACVAAAGNTPGTITMTLSFSSTYEPMSAADISGPLADLFDWVWDQASHTLIGVNNSVIPLGPPLPFTVTVTGKLLTPLEQAPKTTMNWFSETNPPTTNASILNDIAAPELNIDAALPVTLVSFSAAREGKIANLSWATTAETNSDYFEIQRSVNGTTWNRIGSVNSYGESASLKKYTFSDNSPLNGDNLYRLRMVDKDATFAFSKIVNLRFEGLGTDVSVYPNPVSDKLYLRDHAGITKVVITDMAGRTVYQAANASTGWINVKNLPASMYIISVTKADGAKSAQKILVNR
ncbi:hypothetical protein DYBT9275_02494 [Dyadobacter sp. CECT 9275]|uniref:Secretion system C-terminal sorting domain-containing protein n=1 Tax=Dyadobacter helix TaxID=2822344 RepID=A0A916NLG4_9BACT|nr:T9SS type A sorting domain-containing protein [Dyadobacter sp. CECT 9275]CAG5000595.1 hypothetical protein DYBT9275_02494 [Dyadobacter sp. CECT 9275]